MCRLSELHGQKFLVLGNHDKYLFKKYKAELSTLFAKVDKMMEIKVPDPDGYKGVQRIVLCHYAMRVWNKSHYGAWHVYGHSHGSLRDDPQALSTDVGVDACNYRPISYDEVKQRMARKNWQPVDHHRRR